MINLIKSDLYRLFNSKSYKWCAVSSVAITVFVLAIVICTDVELWLMSFTGMEGIRRGFLIGLDGNINFLELIINALGSGAGIYIIAITLTSSTIMEKNRSGMMKNITSYGYERWRIYLSQVIALIIGTSVVIVGTFITILAVTMVIFLPKNVDLESILMLRKVLILYVSIVASTVSIYVFLVTLIPNSEVISLYLGIVVFNKKEIK